MLSRSADVVVRYQGGINTRSYDCCRGQSSQITFDTSGILYPETICLIGSGTVVDPKVMIKEIKLTKDNDIDISGLKLASTAHVTMPYHRLIDLAMEQKRGNQKIGTTGRGLVQLMLTNLKGMGFE